MKVVAFNGSPRKEGNTASALAIVLDRLEEAGIETELVHIGKTTVAGCKACFGCVRNRDERCILTEDPVNEWIAKMKEADGILLGSPVYFAGVAGAMKAFLDRAFFVAGANGALFRHKVGAAVTAVRRSGGLPTFQGLNHYLQYSEMLIPSSNYWNVGHGMMAGDLAEDGEGVQIMEVLGRNMAWLLRLVEHGREAVPAPAPCKKVLTNFVRS